VTNSSIISFRPLYFNNNNKLGCLRLVATHKEPNGGDRNDPQTPLGGGLPPQIWPDGVAKSPQFLFIFNWGYF
jgi:hypothetical protein